MIHPPVSGAPTGKYGRSLRKDSLKRALAQHLRLYSHERVPAAWSAAEAVTCAERRPVRFLAERLDLSEKQLSQLARIVEQIRIEREQAAVDLRRAAAQFADALEGSDFAADAAEAAGRRRVDVAKSVQEVVDRSLRELHALLDADQRDELASLIRTGAIKL